MGQIIILCLKYLSCTILLIRSWACGVLQLLTFMESRIWGCPNYGTREPTIFYWGLIKFFPRVDLWPKPTYTPKIYFKFILEKKRTRHISIWERQNTIMILKQPQIYVIFSSFMRLMFSSENGQMCLVLICIHYSLGTTLGFSYSRRLVCFFYQQTKIFYFVNIYIYIKQEYKRYSNLYINYLWSMTSIHTFQHIHTPFYSRKISYIKLCFNPS